jgi:transposase-like protein
MITLLWKRCGSENLSKNGQPPRGQQNYHGQPCGFYGTLNTTEQERAAKRQLVEALHLERLSQRAMARSTGRSRSTIMKRLKKSPPPHRRDAYPIQRPPHFRAG